MNWKSVTLKHAKTYMAIAELWSQNSKCARSKVGCIIVKDNTIISDGYNGTPSGFCNDCEDHTGASHAYVLHAEANALAKLLRSGHSSEGAELFTTLSPCLECAKLIYQAGISHVYYKEPYRSQEGIKFLKQTSILTTQL